MVETGVFNLQKFLTVLKAGRSKIKAPAHSIPGEGPLLGLPKDSFFLCPHVAKKHLSYGSSCSRAYLILENSILITSQMLTSKYHPSGD